jgi:hypothetical protein
MRPPARPVRLIPVVACGLKTWRTTSAAAEREAILAGRQELRYLAKLLARAGSARPCLTRRSSGAPTACHQAPATGTVYIFCGRALATDDAPGVTRTVKLVLLQDA